MDFFTSLQHQLDALQRVMRGTTASGSIPEQLHQLSDDDLQAARDIAVNIQRESERLRHATTGVIAQRTLMAAHARPQAHPHTQVQPQAQAQPRTRAQPQVQRANIPVHA